MLTTAGKIKKIPRAKTRLQAWKYAFGHRRTIEVWDSSKKGVVSWAKQYKPKVYKKLKEESPPRKTARQKRKLSKVLDLGRVDW